MMVTTVIAALEGLQVSLRYDDVTGAVEEGEVENQTGQNVRLSCGSSTRTFSAVLGAGNQAFSIPAATRNSMNMGDIPNFFLNVGLA